ncbi:hypothetical protein K491DRAFT_684717 [Lophiostoma macrostomum CBS 122681]|uniref:Uncharacterized protein n=1 Tax=Lophiostoma macrostomum CBS 122681 TaxID=1314788 RepID=A0A6A6SKJ6_9PLEO|nr:hypothetical protein K491DRAFT_684717 [Lophiostoma macrostomum CBS 122681]
MKISVVSEDPRGSRVPKPTHDLRPSVDDENFPCLPRQPVLSYALVSKPWKDKASIFWRDAAVKQGRISGFLRFLELPLEIREQVFEDAMRAGGHLDRRVDVWEFQNCFTSVEWTAWLPAVCWASKKTRIEAAPVYIRNVHWVIRRIEANRYFTQFLETIPDDKGILAAQHMCFTSFHWFPGIEKCGKNSDIELMSRTTGLTRLLMTFHMEKLTKRAPEDSDQYYMPKSVQELVDFYGLQGITRARNVEHIHFDGIIGSNFEVNCSGSLKDRMRDLIEWIKEEFRRTLKKEIETELTWRSYMYGYTSYSMY